MGESRIFFLRKILQICSKEKQKLEETIPEQRKSSDHLSVHGPSKNTGKCILKEKIERLALL